ncbi:MAG: hypothetical protein ACXW11_10025 [Methylotenera sp.]
MNTHLRYALGAIVALSLSACGNNKAPEAANADEKALIQAFSPASNANGKESEGISSLPKDAKEFKCELNAVRFSIGRSVIDDKLKGIESLNATALVLKAIDTRDASNRLKSFLEQTGQLNGVGNRMDEGFEVKACEAYTLSTLGAKIIDIPLDQYRVLNEREDLALLYSITPDNDNDKIAGNWSWKVKQEEDVFEHKKMVAATLPEIERAIANAKDKRAIVMTTLGTPLSHYDMKDGVFKLNLGLGKDAIVSQNALRDSSIDGASARVGYILEGDGRFNVYKPKNDEEAAKIEKYAEKTLKVKIYAQAISADPSKMAVSTKVTAVRVFDYDLGMAMKGNDQEKLLFEIK